MAKSKAGQKARRSSNGSVVSELHAFASDGFHFASVVPHAGQARLRVWALRFPTLDAGHSAPTPIELLSDLVLSNVQAICLSWIPQPDVSRKKRRLSGNFDARLAIGTHDGRVLLVTPSRASVSAVLVDDSLSEEHPVIGITSTMDRLFAGYDDGQIRVFDVQGGGATTSAPLLRIFLPDGMLPRKLAVNSSGLLVGDKDIHFYPLSSQDAPVSTHSFTSHGEPLTHLAWIGPGRFASTSQGSNEARIYTLSKEGSKTTRPDAHMVTASPIHMLRFLGTDPADTARIVTIDSAGTASLYLMPNALEFDNSDPAGSKKKRKSKGFNLPAAVSVVATLPVGQSCVDAALDFEPSGKTELTLAFSQGGEVGMVTALVRGSAEQAFSSIQLVDLKNIPPQATEPTVLSIGQALPPSQRDSPVDVEMEMAEPSLESRLKGLDVQAPLGSETTGSVTYGISLGKMDATALARAVTDAVSSKNEATSIELLANSQFSASVTKGAVKRMVGPIAVQVLDAALQRLGAPAINPVKSHRLITWIRLVLITHTRYMMTRSSLVDRLAKLNAQLEARLRGKDKFTELHGRLNLILAQLEVRAHLARADTSPAEGEVVQGQEEGDIQDIALGADESGPESAEEEVDDELAGSEAMEDNALESSSAPDVEEEQGAEVDVSEDEDEDEADGTGSLEDFIVDDSDEELDDSDDSEDESSEEEEPRPNAKAARSRAGRALLDDEAEEASDDESE